MWNSVRTMANGLADLESGSFGYLINIWFVVTVYGPSFPEVSIEP